MASKFRERTHVGWAHNAANLFHGVEIRAETTMHCEDLLIDYGSNGQAVEAVCKRLPELDIVSSLTLIIEAINAVDRSAFMVATKDEKFSGYLIL